jgi:thioredoxin reductase (NADPH)
MSDLQSKIQPQAFSELTDEQIALLRPFGEVRPTEAGEVLYEVGDATYPLVVVLSGQTEIVDRSDESDQVIATTGPGGFNGELGLLTGQTVFAACVVREPGEVLLIPPTAVHEAIETIPVLSDVLITAFAWRRQVLMRVAAATLTLIGPDASPSILHLQEFVSRNRIPSRWFPPDDPAALALLERFDVREDGDVWVIVRGQKALRDPSILYLAKALGLDLAVYQEAPADLIVVGAGPAGLAAAVYGASEGLTTVAVDDLAIGGQAGTSSRIENYLGFPTGISGGELAFRAEVQAVKFGARVTVPRRATALTREDGHYLVRLDDKSDLRGRSVIIATGARYRRLGLPDQERFDGAGVYYAATDLEARRCREAEVVVVGGGNSAGQAAMFLAATARCVHLVYRGPVLGRSMSYYLVSRLEHSPNVRIHTGSEVQILRGDERLESVTIVNGRGQRETIAAPAVFVMIGSDPCTDWLHGAIELDERGFVVTGLTAAEDGSGATSPYETSLPGVFAVGDVRSGSIKRVASAVGEGSVVVQAVHQYLAASGTGER